MTKQQLVLEDGTTFIGTGFGSTESISGEVVFYNGITGYQEMISDPANAGKIIVMTQPLVGNYGINQDDFETLDPCINGLIVKEVSDYPSNFRMDESLDSFFKAHDIPGITGVDTRKLVTHIRNQGSMKGSITNIESSLDSIIETLTSIPEQTNVVEQVSAVKPYIIPGRGSRIVIIDLGIKHGILRELTKRGCHITVVPYNYGFERIMRLKPEGVLLSNGPGNPTAIPEVIETIKELIGKTPLFGIGLGQLLFGLACGASTEKLPYGQYGNYPVKDLETNQSHLVAKSQSYTITNNSLDGTKLEKIYIGLNDKTVEGLKHKEYPAFSVQFNPEGSPGPEDNIYLFDSFIQEIKQFSENKEDTSNA